MIMVQIIHLIKCHKIIPKNTKMRACRKPMTSKLCVPVHCITQEAQQFPGFGHAVYSQKISPPGKLVVKIRDLLKFFFVNFQVYNYFKTVRSLMKNTSIFYG